MNPKILVGCPTYDGKAYCLKEYAGAVKNLDYGNYDFVLVDNSSAYEYYEKLKSLGINAWHLNEKDLSVRGKIVACRNLLRKMVIEKYDYFLSLEQDVIPPKDIIKKLLAHNKLIISAVYNMRMDDGKDHPLLWRFFEGKEAEEFIAKNPKIGPEVAAAMKKGLLCKRYEPGELPKDKLIKIAACGLGAVLIHKSVLEKITFRASEKKDGYDDVFFCQDALANGFEIFADTGVICEHFQDEKFMPK